MNLKNDKFQCLSNHINTYTEHSISLKPLAVCHLISKQNQEFIKQKI